MDDANDVYRDISYDRSMFFFIEVLHTKYHVDANADAHGFCGQKEFVKELQMFYENNAY